MLPGVWFLCFFFFNDTATTEIYTLSLHDALPILFCANSERKKAPGWAGLAPARLAQMASAPGPPGTTKQDRKSTRLNSSHGYISYAVFCLKKKKIGLMDPQP